MKLRSLACTLLLLNGIPSRANAEMVVFDALLGAAASAGSQLEQGEDRKEILRKLDRAIAANLQSPHRALAEHLGADLADSIRQLDAEKQANGAYSSTARRNLMESQMELFLVAHADNWGALRHFENTHPRDPMLAILRADRRIIATLLPRLTDISPARSTIDAIDRPPAVARVCDLALAAIEFHSKCLFHLKAPSGKLFHELPAEDRAMIIRNLEQWWNENQDKSVAEGLRAQMPHAYFHAKVEMTLNLARLEGGIPGPDREYAVGVLKTLVQESHSDFAVYAAEALAKLGDLSPVEVLHSRWRESLDRPGQLYDSATVIYLTDHGTRREWELLNEIARKEIEAGKDAGAARVWPALVNCPKAKSSPYAIPGLALALTQTRTSGSRSFDGIASQDFSLADIAAERLQHLTGMDFGYHARDSSADRAAAIAKARVWWEREGAAKFTFTRIESAQVDSH